MIAPATERERAALRARAEALIAAARAAWKVVGAIDVADAPHWPPWTEDAEELLARAAEEAARANASAVGSPKSLPPIFATLARRASELARAGKATAVRERLRLMLGELSDGYLPNGERVRELARLARRGRAFPSSDWAVWASFALALEAADSFTALGDEEAAREARKFARARTSAVVARLRLAAKTELRRLVALSRSLRACGVAKTSAEKDSSVFRVARAARLLGEAVEVAVAAEVEEAFAEEALAAARALVAERALAEEETP